MVLGTELKDLVKVVTSLDLSLMYELKVLKLEKIKLN